MEPVEVAYNGTSLEAIIWHLIGEQIINWTKIWKKDPTKVIKRGFGPTMDNFSQYCKLHQCNKYICKDGHPLECPIWYDPHSEPPLCEVSLFLLMPNLCLHFYRLWVITLPNWSDSGQIKVNWVQWDSKWGCLHHQSAPLIATRQSTLW